MDLQLNFNGVTLQSEIAIKGGDAVICDDLTTSVLVSLFTWRRAEEGDILPHWAISKMGWWGDHTQHGFSSGGLSSSQGVSPHLGQIGSKLWLLSREKITPKTMQRAKQYAEEALEWMIEDRVAKSVNVEVKRTGINSLALTVIIVTANDEKLNYQFTYEMQP